MPRHTRKFALNNDINIVYNTINNFLISEGYKPTTLNGLNIYKKGTGALKDPNYFSFTCDDKTLTMETWTSCALFPTVDVGEYDLKTPFYILKERGWVDRVGFIENMIINQLGCPLIPEIPQQFPIYNGF